LVRVTSSDADEELKELVSQAKVCDGAANAKTELMPNRRAMARAVRRGDDPRLRIERDMRSAHSGGVRGYSGDVATVGWGLGCVRGAKVPSAGAPRYRAVRSGRG
jgi:hypothetical protein